MFLGGSRYKTRNLLLRFGVFVFVCTVTIGITSAFGIICSEAEPAEHVDMKAETVLSAGSDISKASVLDDLVTDDGKLEDKKPESNEISKNTKSEKSENSSSTESMSKGLDVAGDVGCEVSSEPEVVDLGTSVCAYGSYHAHDDGSLVEWEPGYYIAHNWSEAGEKISGLSVGSVFRLNGNTYTVDAVDEFSEDIKYEDTRSIVGWDALCLQTCIPNSGVFKLAYVSGVGDFSSYIHELGYWTSRDECYSKLEQPEVVEEEVVYEYEEPVDSPEPVPMAYGSISVNAAVEGWSISENAAVEGLISESS